MVKNLRIITTAVQCGVRSAESALSRLDNTSTVALLLRKAVLLSKAHSAQSSQTSEWSSDSVAPDGSLQHAILTASDLKHPGIRLLMNAASAYLSNAADFLSTSASDDNEFHRNHYHERSTSTATASLTASSESKEMTINAAFEQDDVDELLRLLFSAIDVIKHCSLSTSQHNKQHSDSQLSSSADEMAVFYNISQTLDSHGLCTMLYPHLYPVDTNLLVGDSRPIRLSRQAMVLNSSPYYFLDAQTELVLYQSLFAVPDQHFVISATQLQHIQQSPLPLNVDGQLSRKTTRKRGSFSNQSNKTIYSSSKTGDQNLGISNRKFLPNLLSDRVPSGGSSAPEIRRAQAGQASAGLFHRHLLDDISRCGMTFGEFKTLLKSMLV